MTHTEFLESYNPDNRCLVTYTDALGKRAWGIALDKPTKRLSGLYAVDVGSFCTSVTMSNVISVSDTGVRW